MEMCVDWEAEKGDCRITADHSDDSIGASDYIDQKPSLLLEVEEVSLPPSSLSGSLDASSDTLDLPLVLHCTEEDSSLTTTPKTSTYCRQQGSAIGGIYVPTSNTYNLLSDGKDLARWSSRHSADLQGGLKEEAENFIILVDSLDGENLPALLGKFMPYQCEKCGKSFQDLRGLEEHKKKYVSGCSYWCPICGKEFFRSANLRMHKLTHSADRPHKCPECDKGFIRTADVWRHLRSMHKIDRSSVVLGDASIKNPWSVLHRNQNQSYNSGQLNSAARDPGEGGFKRHQCPTCCKVFSNANLLSKHKVIHRKEKPYKCNKCSMAFVQLSRLRRHHQTHTGERPFYCEECGTAFTRLASLQRHRRTHTGEKPYSCACCGQSFAELGSLRRHEGVHKIVQP
ncbi:zinc finger protein 648 [Eublepharis macularius]|uniref:Zinc finger protein 648 n=1 Tax=Eublepharis macularius TaxID=481883 RepID=A0AA97JFG6_EUBMA|nr:zinc finger protein 648 [Eublepharis macularius]